MRANTIFTGLTVLALLIAARSFADEPQPRDFADCNENGIDDSIDVEGESETFTFPGGPLPATGGYATFNGAIPDLGPILDLDVALDVTHGWTGYFTAQLYHPDGTYRRLIEEPGNPDIVVGGFGDTGFDVVLDDEAPSAQSIQSVTAGGGIVTGRYKPFWRLYNNIDGKESVGTWQLKAARADYTIAGTVNEWSLIFTTTLPVSEDCQGDLVPDECQLTDNDCDANGVPDECDPDCNGNSVADGCDVSGGTSTDCDGNNVPDECEPDCNTNAIADACDIAGATSVDCQPDGVPDECQVGVGPTEVLWDNGDPIDDLTLAADFGPQPADVLTADDIELPLGGIVETVTWTTEEEAGFAWDGRVRLEIYPRIRFLARPYVMTHPGANVPDLYRGPTVSLWIPDDGGAVTRTSTGAGAVAPRYEYEISGLDITLPPGTWWIGVHVPGTGRTGSGDDAFWVPSAIDLFGTLPSGEAHVLAPDSGMELFPAISAFVTRRYEMAFSVAGRLGSDCNGNAIPDDCDADAVDENENGVPDDCEPDCNGNNIPDDYDLNHPNPFSQDCNHDTIPDECQLVDNDCNGNDVPDECDWDCNDNAIPDDCDIGGGTSLDCQPDGIPDECQLLAEADADSAATWLAREPDLSGGAWGSSIDPRYGTIRADDFTPIEDDLVRSVAWDGLYYHSPEPCPSQTRFSIVLFANDDSPIGEPEGVLAVWEDVPTHATRVPYLHFSGVSYQMIEFQALLEPAYPVQAGQTYWLAVVAETGCQGELIWWTHDIAPDSLSAKASIDAAGGSYSELYWHQDWFDFSLRISRGAGDCNGNEVPDDCDAEGNDANGNGVPDDCDPDCNENGVPDDLDISDTTSEDCTSNGIPDECEPDCNGNTIADSCDIDAGTDSDCQPDGVPDACQLAGNDCNGNLVPDECDLWAETSPDCNQNGIPDECEVASVASSDCQFNGVPDECEINAQFGVAQENCEDAEAACPGITYRGIAEYRNEMWYRYAPGHDGTVLLTLASDFIDPMIALHEGCSFNPIAANDDFDGLNSHLAVEVFAGIEYSISVSSFAGDGEFTLTLAGPQCLEGDANANGRPDACEDCNTNDIPDDEDVAAGTSTDINGNDIPDECEDCNGNGTLDSVDIAASTSTDCNENGRPDECDLADGLSGDCNGNAIPDDCEQRALSAQTQDHCADAEEICAGVLYHGGTGDASADGTSGCDIAETGVDVWYRYIPALDGELTVGVQNADFAPLLSVHNGCPGDPADELACDDYRFNVLPVITLDVTAGQSYRIRVAAYEGPTGEFELLLKGPPCAAADLNGNGVLDWYDIAAGTSTDCDDDLVPDECEADCNTNTIPDPCDIAAGTSTDCTGNTIPDECEPDCNTNLVADSCDIAGGTSDDCDLDGTPDECQPDSDGDMTIDACEWCDQHAGKLHPGVCGCDVPDTDADGDDYPDCIDGCPQDSDKTEPGLCGCGTPDTDTDGDDIADCFDDCPDEPALITPDEPDVELTCTDGIDNDCDGATDVYDADCAGTCRCGDIDYDGSVNLADFASFAICFGVSGPEADCDANRFFCSDLNGDGMVNLLDFATFALWYGEEPAGDPPDCMP